MTVLTWPGCKSRWMRARDGFFCYHRVGFEENRDASLNQAARAPRYHRSRNQLVPDAMHRQQMARLIAIISQLFPQLDNHLIERACGPVIIVTPDLIQQAVPRQ